jgi:hypothetical protein
MLNQRCKLYTLDINCVRKYLICRYFVYLGGHKVEVQNYNSCVKFKQIKFVSIFSFS